jgi:hypothetical protein
MLRALAIARHPIKVMPSTVDEPVKLAGIGKCHELAFLDDVAKAGTIIESWGQ